MRINAAARLNGLSYNRLINGLKLAGCDVNRKILAELAVEDPPGFAALAESAKEVLSEAQGAAAPEVEEAPAVSSEEPASSEEE